LAEDDLKLGQAGRYNGTFGPKLNKGCDAMGLTHVTVSLRASRKSAKKFEALFSVDIGATDSIAPVSKLKKAGIAKVGRMAYELADGSTMEYDFGLAVIEFMGEVTAGRIIFGPDGSEPLLGVTALESVGVVIDPASQRLKRLPAVPLK
jgi:clan AA aspartic protease